MKTPYEILGVTEQATDSEIKQAYLQKVKQYPPDHHHEIFQQIHGAYETIQTLANREKYALFNYPEADFNALLDQAFSLPESIMMNADLFDKLLRAGIEDQTFLIALPSMAKIS